MYALPFGIIFTLIALAAATATAQGQQAEERSADHTQWGRTPARNNVVDDAKVAASIPIRWNVGEFDFDTGAWQREKSTNIKWVAKLGTNAFGNPVATGGKVFVGTNNDAGYLARFPKDKVDLGVLLCLDQRDGKFLWQYSAAKLPGGDKHDFAATGICSSPLVIGDRLWLVTNRCEVVCLDVEGFRDGENNGPVKDEANENKDEADVIWRFDMMKELDVEPTFMANCSVTAVGRWLFVSTGNGADEFGKSVPKPGAPSFIILDRETGKLAWKDDAIGHNILHGQWSSPAVSSWREGSVIYTTGDGWLRGLRGINSLWWSPLRDVRLPIIIAASDRWRFDCNDKTAIWKPGGRGNRNTIIGTPVVQGFEAYIATGQSPEHGEGPGTLWCIDLVKAEMWHADLSESLVFNPKDGEGKTPIPHDRIQAADAQRGDIIKPNPRSALKWKYTGHDLNRNGKIDADERMHRSISTVAVAKGFVIAADFSGIVHCLDAQTGEPHWTHDMLAGCWGSPLIVGDRIYLGNDNGEVVVFALAKEKKILAVNDMKETVYGTPIVAGNVLYITTKSRLLAIEMLDK